MNNSETNFEDVLKGESKIEIVDKLENLRNQLNSNTLKGRINKKDTVSYTHLTLPTTRHV